MKNYEIPETESLILENNSIHLEVQFKKVKGLPDSFKLREIKGETDNIKYFTLIITNSHLNPNLAMNNSIKTSFNNNFKFGVQIGFDHSPAEFITNF